MSSINKKYPLLIMLCIVFLIAVSGCGSPNQDSAFDPEGESHPHDWLPARHATAAIVDLDECTQCHGSNFSAKTACTECHMESATMIHPGEWEDRVAVRHNEYVDTNGTSQCSNIYCHGGDLDGVALSGPSCSSCHIGGSASFHPEDWEDFAYARHASYVRKNGNSSCSNGACHGADLAGVTESGPSCSSCHLGGPDSYHPREWGSSSRTELGLVRNTTWYIDFNDSKSIDFPADKEFDLGMSGDTPVSGDWNGDGITETGFVRGNRWYLDMNGNGIWDPETDNTFKFGIPGDLPVTGDWNGDGFTEVGALRGNRWYLDMNGNGTWDSETDTTFKFGNPGDMPASGDWNGDGFTEVGVLRGIRWYLDMDGSGTWNPETDSSFIFGIPGGIPVTGDWNGDRKTDVGVFNNGEWKLDSNANNTYDANSDASFTFGIPGDVPITGDWNRSAIVNLHGIYVSSRGGDSCTNAACHGADLSGVEESGPSCFICHGPNFPAAGIR